MDNRNYSQGNPKDPIREVLRHLVGEEPPTFVRGYDTMNLTDRQLEELTPWILNTLSSTELYWSTGIGIIEAAENIVAEAVANANIPPKESR